MPGLVLRRNGPFETILPLLRRLRRRLPSLKLQVVQGAVARSESVSPKRWCDDHGITWREEALGPRDPRSRSRVLPSLLVGTDEAGLPDLRFIPDPFDDDFDAFARSSLKSERSRLRIWLAEDHAAGARAAGFVTFDLDSRDTTRSVLIKARAACRDLLENILSDSIERRDFVLPSNAAEMIRGDLVKSPISEPASTPFSMVRLSRSLLARAALSCGAVQLRNWLDRRSGHAPGVVINFHRVADDATGHWMTVPTDEFSAYVQYLTENYKVVSLSDLRERLAGGRNVEPLVSITFDDGYRECLTCAAPVLEEFGCTASFFVCSRFFEEDGDFEHDAQRGHLGLEKLRGPEVRRLHELGFEIGSHGHTHMDFRFASEAAIDTELSVSRRKVQTEIGADVYGFAVPFGSAAHCRPEVFSAARRSGYGYVLSHFDGRNRPGANMFHLLRVRPNLEGLLSLRAAVEGWRGFSGLLSPVPHAQIPEAEEARR